MAELTALYVAFGNENFFREVLFSYLNLRQVMPHGTYRVVIYTDNPGWFAAYPGLILEHLDSERLHRWIGVAGCVFRSKIFAMRDCMDKYPDSCLLYMDGDTFFNKDPSDVLSKLSPQTAIMNFPEAGRVNGINNRASEWAVEKSKDIWKQLGIPGVPETWRMWNAGIIGLHPSQRRLLDQVLYVNDVLFYRSLNRIIEQVAQSVILGSRCNLIPLDEEVVHYFAMEDDMLPHLKTFFEENRSKPFDELVSRATTFRPAMTHDKKLRGTEKLKNSINKREKEMVLLIRKQRRRLEWRQEIAQSRKLAVQSL